MACEPERRYHHQTDYGAFSGVLLLSLVTVEGMHEGHHCVREDQKKDQNLLIDRQNDQKDLLLVVLMIDLLVVLFCPLLVSLE